MICRAFLILYNKKFDIMRQKYFLSCYIYEYSKKEDYRVGYYASLQ